jgi:hypothetical protein
MYYRKTKLITKIKKMKEIYQKIIEKLTSAATVALFQEAGILPVRFVDLYKGQYLDYSKFEITPLPAVYVDWKIIITNPTQNESTAMIMLHLAYETVPDTSSLSLQRNEALKLFDYINLVQQVVATIQVEGIGKLKLRNIEPVQLDNPGQVILLTYETAIQLYQSNVINQYELIDTTDAELEIDGGLVKTFSDT